MVRHNFTVSL